MKPSPLVLEYGRSTAAPIRAARVIVIVVLAIASCAAWKYGRVIERHAQQLWYQRQCMTYQPANDVAATALRTKPDLDAFATNDWSDSYGFGCCPSSARIWREFASTLAKAPYRAGATVYLHVRRNAGGNRLVHVAVRTWQTPNGFPTLIVDATVVRPGTLFRSASVVWQRGVWSQVAWPQPAVAVGTGICDTTNESCFTIPCVDQGTMFSLTGVLRDDDTIAVISSRRS